MQKTENYSSSKKTLRDACSAENENRVIWKGVIEQLPQIGVSRMAPPEKVIPAP